MSDVFRSPMLAKEHVREQLRFPGYASPKIDGIRVVQDSFNGEYGPFSRSGKMIRNQFVRSTLSSPLLHGIDGEITIGPINAPNVYNTTQGVMKEKGAPDFTLNVFDYRERPGATYMERRSYASEIVALSFPRIVLLEQRIITNMEEFDEAEAEYTSRGFEGMMYRADEPAYHFGRSSPKHGGLLKVKRFVHDEARIVGLEEAMHNENDAFVNELGRTSRSTAAAGRIPSGMISAYVCESPAWKETFRVSCTSLSHDERRELLHDPSKIGCIVRFKHLPHGAKDRPRHALFAGFRDPDDLS